MPVEFNLYTSLEVGGYYAVTSQGSRHSSNSISINHTQFPCFEASFTIFQSTDSPVSSVKSKISNFTCFPANFDDFSTLIWWYFISMSSTSPYCLHELTEKVNPRPIAQENLSPRGRFTGEDFFRCIKTFQWQNYPTDRVSTADYAWKKKKVFCWKKRKCVKN